MKKGSTLLLKLAVIVMGIPVLLIAVLVLPKIVLEAMGFIGEGMQLPWIVLGLMAIMYISAIPFYMALYQALKLLGYIDRNEAFSELSVGSLKKIRNYGFTISGLYVVALPFIFMIAQWDDAPGLALIGIVIVGASFVIAVFAAVLQRLLKQAIDIKQENDLTV
ncbi:DUF2975 domain-containing protein [Bhargavaea ginsengi]|uniref:DUF2975 domain-containing protein n=1 Tax=Bhargavaea ginsengi TaxID=426757 RepID=UPI00203F83C8|nr:DUF2975 domain-containing protein [Bhargavaea ginsengi]MCM3086759.1 DUF2975 domain-containing protein [Bhargavaea ginsengi]